MASSVGAGGVVGCHVSSGCAGGSSVTELDAIGSRHWTPPPLAAALGACCSLSSSLYASGSMRADRRIGIDIGAGGGCRTVLDRIERSWAPIMARPHAASTSKPSTINMTVPAPSSTESDALPVATACTPPFRSSERVGSKTTGGGVGGGSGGGDGGGGNGGGGGSGGGEGELNARNVKRGAVAATIATPSAASMGAFPRASRRLTTSSPAARSRMAISAVRATRCSERRTSLWVTAGARRAARASRIDASSSTACRRRSLA